MVLLSISPRKQREGPSLQGAFLLIKAYTLILFIRIFQIRSETFLFWGGLVLEGVGWCLPGGIFFSSFAVFLGEKCREVISLLRGCFVGNAGDVWDEGCLGIWKLIYMYIFFILCMCEWSMSREIWKMQYFWYLFTWV